MAAIIGRESEKELLNGLLESPDPEFLAVFGRRRVGKTFLIREFFGEQILFEITGSFEGTRSEQLRNFAFALSKLAGSPVQLETPASWQEAFFQLIRVLESLPPPVDNQKRVLFFDELPWLATHCSRFVSALSHFWNSWVSRENDIILVVCGSAASWMIRKILRDRGGLHNRVTRRIRLAPLDLKEVKAFLESRNIALTPKQIIEIVLCMGGIPHYLKVVRPGMSAGQIIDMVCLSENGLLYDEFEQLYSSLFHSADDHKSIVRALAKKPNGMQRSEISRTTKIPSGGKLTQLLDELKQSGFIATSVPFGGRVNNKFYRLVDEYSLFYLRWIEPSKTRKTKFGNLASSPNWIAWSSLAFESVCQKHIVAIKSSLGIAAVETEESKWAWSPPENEESDGAQIDLIIDRRDDCINLCEIKFHGAEYTITKQDAKNFRHKVETFRRVTGTKKNLFFTMITTHGVAPNKYYNEIVSCDVVVDDLFVS